MLFTSWEFLLFIGIIFILYYLIPKKGQWILLLCASLLFYFIAGWTGLIFMGIAVFSTYLVGLAVSSVREKRTAYFVTVITLVYPDGRVIAARGECHGYIAEAERGDRGFGYDSIFIPEGSDKTFAELPAEYKNGISHRANALKRLEELI